MFGDQLQKSFQGSVCLMGLGNQEYGDDGLGVHLAEAIAEKLSAESPADLDVIVAGTTPERFLGHIDEKKFDHLVFLDAVEFGGAPGSVIFLNAEQMAARYPQISTHKISLGLLAKFIEASGTTKAWLLGVQPESIKASERLTPTVQRSIEVLEILLCSAQGGETLRELQQWPATRSIAEVDYANP